MPPARGATNPNSILIALMIFIFLFLVSTIIAVIQYMNVEQVRRQGQTASDRFAELATSSEYNQVKYLVKKRGDRVQSTAMKQITADMRATSGMVAGETAGNIDLAGTRGFAENEVAQISEQVTELLTTAEDEPLIQVTTADGQFVGLVDLTNQLLQLILDVTHMNRQLQKDMEGQVVNYENALAQLDLQVEKLNQDLAIASKSALTAEEKYVALEDKLSQNYEQIITTLNEQSLEIKDELDKTQQDNEELSTQKDIASGEIKDLRELLKQYRPTPDGDMAALETDGYIISVVPNEKLAYINLNNKDSIYRGLTFTVYDSYQEISSSGKGKGSVEVLEMFDTISKCRITDYDPTNPIMEKDTIANLVWNKNVRHLFCVAGEFDFNGDGKIDPQGRQRIENLITNWGGQAISKLSVDTDFLVLGHAPVVGKQPSEDELDRNTQVAEAWREADQKAADYANILSDSASLGVPTFNLNRFLYFIGYYQQAKSPI